MQLDVSRVPRRIGHNYEPVKVLPISFLKTDYAKTHRRLMVFHHKGLGCANPGCEKVGSYVIVGKDSFGGEHIDIYTKNFELMTVDHILPKAKGGSDVLANKQPMCEKCNTKKADKVPVVQEASEEIIEA